MKKILIADKDESLKKAFSLIFPKEEYEILHTKMGKEVLSIARKEKPEIFIVNVDLYDTKGQEVLKALRDEGLLKERKFYFLKDQDVTEDLSQYEVDGVIDKPINYLAVHELLIDTAKAELHVAEKKKEIASEPFLEFGPKDIEKTFFELKDELQRIVDETIEETKTKLAAKIESLLKVYIELYVEKKLPEIAEKVLKEKIEKMMALLKR